MAESFIGVGANLGDCHGALCDAADALARLSGTRVTGRSRIYRSAPIGPAGQADYLNAALAIDTQLPAMDLLAALQSIEAAAGRRRDGVRWGPRTLDLDMLLYGDARISTATLTIPHPRIAQRNFVLAPLIDVAGEQSKIGGRSLGELLRNAPENELTITTLEWPSRAVVYP